MRTEALLLCAVGLAACSTPPPPAAEEEGKEVVLGEGDCTGTGAVTVRVANEDRAIPLDELRQIRREVDRYLAEEKPELEPSVPAPGKVFIGCQGTAHLGAWLVESAWTSEPEIRLTFRIHTGEALIVRQLIGLRLEDGEWKATGAGRETSHRLR